MQELHFATLAALGHAAPSPAPFSFALENGEALLRAEFDDIECHVLEEATVHDSADDLTEQYINTGGYDWARRDERIPEETRAAIPAKFRELTGERIRREGALRTERSWTTFVATVRRSA